MIKGNDENRLPRHSQDSKYHIPVLLTEVIEGLAIKPGGVYVDCTFGGGGHAKAILDHLATDGKLIAFDQDEDAKQNVPNDQRVVFVPHNFRHLKRFLQLNGLTEVDGVLADLGVSSHQFDEAEPVVFLQDLMRAFDMRMDQRQQKTAFDIVSKYSELQLQKIFEQYGEVTNAKTLARTIVEARNATSMETIEGFKNGVSQVW